MNSRQILIALTALAAIESCAAVVEASGTLIRWHQMGEYEGGTNNAAVFATGDTPVDAGDFQPMDLTAVNSPVYRTIPVRPDGGTGIGIEFNSAAQGYLQGSALNGPADSELSEALGGLYDLTGITDRGFQLWVRPTSTAVQTIIMDTNNHGVRISSNGKFSMRYANVDYESTVTVNPNTWYHIEVVHPGGLAGGSTMYINGSAAAIARPPYDYLSDYFPDMSIGANAEFNGEYYSGLVDDLRMYVFGVSTSGWNYGAFNILADNAYLASPVLGLKGIAGDVNNDGSLTLADKSAFIAGWMSKRLVNGYQIGDLTSYQKGDLNLDGTTDIQDLLLMQNALSGKGMAAISAHELVPEPSGLCVVAAVVVALLVVQRG
ncbi:MAG: LamG-like jellyroll fold domain-containing protein [Pirellulales bacterium]